MKEIKIKAPFYGAGSPKQFNWVKDGYEIYGVGINLEHLREDELRITVEGQTYEVKTEPLREFIKKYRSIQAVKNSMVKVGVVSISLLKGTTRPSPKQSCCSDMQVFGQHFGECKGAIKPVEEKPGKLF